jgi:hypothetical protein
VAGVGDGDARAFLLRPEATATAAFLAQQMAQEMFGEDCDRAAPPPHRAYRRGDNTMLGAVTRINV